VPRLRRRVRRGDAPRRGGHPGPLRPAPHQGSRGPRRVRRHVLADRGRGEGEPRRLRGAERGALSEKKGRPGQLAGSSGAGAARHFVPRQSGVAHVLHLRRPDRRRRARRRVRVRLPHRAERLPARPDLHQTQQHVLHKRPALPGPHGRRRSRVLQAGPLRGKHALDVGVSSALLCAGSPAPSALAPRAGAPLREPLGRLRPTAQPTAGWPPAPRLLGEAGAGMASRPGITPCPGPLVQRNDTVLRHFA